MSSRQEDFEKLGIGIIAVAMSPSEALGRYLQAQSWPFPVLADPARKAYAALGLGQTTWSRLLHPGVVWKYLKLVAKGGKVRRVPEGEDALQLGGDLLLGRDRRLLWIQRGTSPTDRPSADALLEAAKKIIDEHFVPE